MTGRQSLFQSGPWTGEKRVGAGEPSGERRMAVNGEGAQKRDKGARSLRRPSEIGSLSVISQILIHTQLYVYKRREFPRSLLSHPSHSPGSQRPQQEAN